MKIRLMIEGLSAFLPLPENQPEVMHVLIPDVKNGERRRAQGGLRIDVCPHVPHLIFPNGVVWTLEGEHIEISGGGSGLVIQSSFLSRMSDMEKIAPRSEVIHPDFLEDPPRRPSLDVAPLIANLVIRGGEFAVADVDLTPKLVFLAHPKEALPSDLSGRLGIFAAFVQVSIDVPANQAVVSSRKYVDGNGEAREPVALAGDNNEEFVILLRNLCSVPDDPNQPGNDFIMYYDLCFDYDGPRRIPYILEDQGPLIPPGVEVPAEATHPPGCIAGLFRRVGRREQ